MGSIPASLDAKEGIAIAYRVTCLKAYGQPEGSGGGDGCKPYVKCGKIEYVYCCANGQTTETEVGHCVNYVPTGCLGDWGGGSDDIIYGYFTEMASSAGMASHSPPLATLEGTPCYSKSEKEEPETCPIKDTDGSQKMDTGSHVNLKHRTYNRDELDLSIKTIGGNIEIKRYYEDGQWQLGTQNYNMIQSLPGDGDKPSLPALDLYYYTDPRCPSKPVITAIIKNGVVYKLPEENLRLRTEYDGDGNVVDRRWEFPGGRIYLHKTYSITAMDSGYIWKKKNGEYRIYSAGGLILSSGNKGGTKSSYIYGENGRITGIKDANDVQVVWFEYNAFNQTTLCRLSDNRQVQYFYTDNLLTSVVDATSGQTHYEYDENKRLVKVIDANGNEKQITYGEQGEIVSVTDQDSIGQTFEYDYDKYKKEYYARTRSASGKVTETWIDEQGDTKKISVNGRVIEKIEKDGRNEIIADENGYVSTKEYDEWDNLVKITYPDATRVVNVYEHETHRLIQKTDENGVVSTFAYDEAGNLFRKTEAKDTDDERITEYTHDAYGNILSVSVLGAPDNTVTQMTYDASGNLTAIIDPEGNLTRFAGHDVMGNVLTKIDADNKTWQYTYDNAGRLLTVTDPLNHVTGCFEYDAVGNKIKEIDARGKETLFEYDSRNNLIKTTQVIDPDAPESNPVTWFEYNVDNKMIKQIDPEGNIITYEYDNEGRLLKTIDGNGNETLMEYGGSSGCTTCTGGGSDHVSKITYPTFVKTFYYDPFGRRLWKEVGGIRTYFQYSDEGLIGEYDASGIETKTYGYKSGSTWTTDPLFIKIGSEYYFCQNDHMGTPQRMTAVNGAVVWSAKYESFGKAVVEVETVENNLRFAGQYYDAESGLHYNYHRYYDPSIGRYLRTDPVGLLGGMNLYSYVQNNPIRYIDNFGLWGEDVHSGIGNTRGYGTYTWARQAGFSESGAGIIARANDAVDGGWGSWMPIFGNQSHHFNQGSYDDYQDSREYWAGVEFNKAIEAWKNGQEDIALAHIGRGLHSLQDIDAHRNWNTGLSGWNPHPQWYDYWDDQRNECAREMTERVTKKYLSEFIRLTYGGYTH